MGVFWYEDFCWLGNLVFVNQDRTWGFMYVYKNVMKVVSCN